MMHVARMPHRILIVDDNARIRVRIRELLLTEFPGADIHEVSSAEDAASRLLDAGPFDLILLDVQLPGQNGIAALPALRARQPETAIVMLSCKARDQYGPAALRAGARAFVAKERIHEELVDVVAPLLRAAA